MAVKPIPEGFRTLTPHLVVKGVVEAIAFYQKAFGAEVVSMMHGPDGQSVMHAELKIGDSMLMLADEMPMMEYWVSPSQLGGTSIGISICVEDADTWFKRAVGAGATPTMEMTDMFWGDRYGKVRCPWGHEWEFATRIEDLSPEEISERAKTFFASFGG